MDCGGEPAPSSFACAGDQFVLVFGDDDEGERAERFGREHRAVWRKLGRGGSGDRQLALGFQRRRAPASADA